MNIKMLSANQMLSLLRSNTTNEKVFFGQKDKEERWDLPEGSIESLNFEEFDITWAHCPPESKTLKERFEISDMSEFGDLTVQFPVSKYCRYNYRFENQYHFLDNIPVDHIKDFGKNRNILYKYNLEWFRSDNFVKKHDGIHILFSGCSNTEGVGANIEDTWSHMLYSELSKKHKISGYYNIARSGNGWHKMIQNFLVYVKKYGAPDYLFVLHPNILRNFIWNEELSRWRYEQYNPWGETENLDNIISQHRKEFPSWLISWKVFIQYCQSIGTKVLWSTWDTWEIDNIKRCNSFDSTFFEIESITNDLVKKQYLDFVTRDDALWARDGHDGYVQQYHWFESFKNEIYKKEWLL
jgi:hypothetical protein